MARSIYYILRRFLETDLTAENVIELAKYNRFHGWNGAEHVANMRTFSHRALEFEILEKLSVIFPLGKTLFYFILF